jgi:hypothetical protein
MRGQSLYQAVLDAYYQYWMSDNMTWIDSDIMIRDLYSIVALTTPVQNQLEASLNICKWHACYHLL